MTKKRKYTQFAVIGLGRFGLSVVKTLSEFNINLLACDKDPIRLQAAADYATHAVQADISDEHVFDNLGLGNFDVIILAMGEDFESSVMGTMMAKERGISRIIAKARGPRQKRILENLGADQVIMPEMEMGAKIARSLMGSNIIDILEESEHYKIAEVTPMEDWIGKSLRQADIRRKQGITVLGFRKGSKLTIPAPPERIIAADDILITLSEY